MSTHEERSARAKAAWATRKANRADAPPTARRTAPDVSVVERQIDPQDALLEGQLEEAQKLIEGRIRDGVFDHRSGEVTFRDPRFVGHWFNEAVNGQRLFQAKQGGWLPATPAMIADLDVLGVYDVDAAGHIVRGQRGEEHLLFMTRENQQRIMRRKTDENLRRLGSGTRTKSDLAEATAREYGDQAGDFIAGTFGEVTDGHEMIERIEDDHGA